MKDSLETPVVTTPEPVVCAPLDELPPLPPEVLQIEEPTQVVEAPSSVGAARAAEEDPEMANFDAGSIFADDDEYFAEQVTVGGDTVINLRELDEKTIFWIQELPQRMVARTENRITLEVARAVFANAEQKAKMPLSIAEAVATLKPEDQKLVGELAVEMRDRILIEGIVKWAGPKTGNVPLTDENKVKLGRKIRDACIKKIMAASGFAEREQNFLAES